MNTQVETPSGKGAADENFPVGSFLLPKALRPHIAIFYAFARAIDDIADNNTLPPGEKITRLDAFAGAVETGSNDPALIKADHLHHSLRATNVTTRHALDLISAFKQDSVKSRYQTWDDLMDYCDRSAAPVGRYLLDLHGEDRAGYPPSDALCNALQVINHTQDCADDYRDMDRVYIPQDWLNEAGGTTGDLALNHTTPGLRNALHRMMAGTDALLIRAARLPGALKSRRLALESAVILQVARRLTRRLKTEDPIATRVELSKAEKLGCAFSGVVAGFSRRKG